MYLLHFLNGESGTRITWKQRLKKRASTLNEYRKVVVTHAANIERILHWTQQKQSHSLWFPFWMVACRAGLDSLAWRSFDSDADHRLPPPPGPAVLPSASPPRQDCLHAPRGNITNNEVTRGIKLLTHSSSSSSSCSSL